MESQGRVNTSEDLVRQMWYMNMRIVVMVFAGAGWGKTQSCFTCNIASKIFKPHETLHLI